MMTPGKPTPPGHEQWHTPPAHRVGDVLIQAGCIQQRIRELLAAMARDIGACELMVIGILRGSFIFLADLVRGMNEYGLHPRIDFVTASSYGGGTKSSGRVDVLRDLRTDVQGATVLLVDDILDTGRTLDTLRNHLLKAGARQVFTCTLLDKPSRRLVPISADYVGFQVPDTFVVGYGLDYDGRYRELPFIAQVAFDDAPPDSP